MLVLFVFSATITDNFVFNKISSCDLAELWNSASRNLSLRDSILVIRSTSTWLGGKLFGKSKMKVQITIKLETEKTATFQQQVNNRSVQKHRLFAHMICSTRHNQSCCTCSTRTAIRPGFETILATCHIYSTKI